LPNTLRILVGNRVRVDGGGNIDTLALDGGGLTLDLTNISNIRIQDATGAYEGIGVFIT
jgi:hypothetical protein